MKNRKLFRIIFMVFIILGFQLSVVHGTVVIKLSEVQLVNYAQTILMGRCTSIRSEWNEEGTKIFTYITISAQSFLKGDQFPEEITIEQLGGEVGEIGMWVDEASVFEEGEEVLLFLKKGRPGYHRILGLSQGKFSIETDRVSGRKVLLRKKLRLSRYNDGRIRKRIVEIESDKKIFLDEFTDRVHNILRKRNNSKH